MTHAEWLRTREPPAPPALVARIEALLLSHPEWDATARADAFVDAAELLLRRVMVGDAAARGSALDLLAADACVTYAFEAAADEPQGIAGRARNAEDRITRVAEEFRAAELTTGAERAS